MITISADGKSIGTADEATAVTQFGPDEVSLVLEGFSPTEPEPSLLYWFELYKREFSQRIKAEELAEARGKTIHELTEKFKEKKQRIHDFYAPQLKNRADENRELQLQQDRVDMWIRWYREDVGKLSTRNSALAKELEELKARTSTSGETYRDLRQKVEYYKDDRDHAVSVIEAHIKERSDLIAKLNAAEAELRELKASTNKFVDSFNEAIDTLDTAAAQWNDEVAA